MILSEKLKVYRTSKGLSQEKAAELLGVSRQAVTKWEAGKTTPSSDHLIALANLYDVPLDELIGSKTADEYENKNRPKNNPILQANLTKISIMCQTIFLNAAFQKNELSNVLFMNVFRLFFVFLPLLLSSIWMAFNLRYEKDKKQLKKNTRIELLYCVVQVVIALIGYYAKLYFPMTISLIIVCLVYILYINPKYMNRQLVKKK